MSSKIIFRGRRLLASLIDYYFLCFLLNVPFYFVWQDSLREKRDMLLVSGVYLVFSLFCFIIYWYILEKYYHTTLGKKLMKLKVIDEGKGNYLIRSICKFLPFDIISFLLTKDGRFWHDNLSNTNVIEIEKKSIN